MGEKSRVRLLNPLQKRLIEGERKIGDERTDCNHSSRKQFGLVRLKGDGLSKRELMINGSEKVAIKWVGCSYLLSF